MSQTNRSSKAKLGKLGRAAHASLPAPRPSTPENDDVEMSSPVPSPQMTTSTDIANTTFDESVANINRRLEQIDEKHTKALEGQAETLGEMNELVAVCGKEIQRVEGDAETVNGIVTRFEEEMRERLDKVERQLEKLTKL
ncbi:hypothetical protein CDV36_010300 [Fusarium kuroshium]|uniref:Uncharacterized protein n=1 Tax=Fusarium kuroshium TaxID=2010991 RepID=A0A3M2RXV2_9HYPO|nr:hypothetical protein CDV36_010300 [Fusarium kuroshium]